MKKLKYHWQVGQLILMLHCQWMNCWADWSAMCEAFWSPSTKHTRPWAWDIHAMFLLFLPSGEYSTRTSILYTQFQKHSSLYIIFQISFIHRNNNCRIQIRRLILQNAVSWPLVHIVCNLNRSLFIYIIWETKGKE